MSGAVAPITDLAKTVEQARGRWLAASEKASTVATELYRPGSGYGDPEAEKQDRYRLETVRADAERLFREYQDLERRHTDQLMLQLQRSQHLATWAISVSLLPWVSLRLSASLSN